MPSASATTWSGTPRSRSRNAIAYGDGSLPIASVRSFR